MSSTLESWSGMADCMMWLETIEKRCQAVAFRFLCKKYGHRDSGAQHILGSDQKLPGQP